MKQKKQQQSRGRRNAMHPKLEKMVLVYALICVILFCLLLIAPAVFSMTCETMSTTCVEQGGIKIIQGVEVTLDCWKYETQQTCHADTTDTCDSLRTQGCQGVDASCIESVNGTCLAQKETFSCALNTCDPNTNNKKHTDMFCADGKCGSPVDAKSTDFEKAVSELAAVNGSGKDIADTKGMNAFEGKAMECADNMLGYKNCCRDTGWGKDINLAHCTDTEKALGEKREKGLSVYVGRYCHNRIDYGAGSVCTSHHQVYCVFDTKIAKAIQAQGRRGQLGITFGAVGGDDAYPNCRGLSVDELSQLDFSSIDFSAIYQDIKDNMQLPNSNRLEKIASDKVKQFYEKGQSYAK
jgi:conjugal transfer mating pair stabilization protein TraN